MSDPMFPFTLETWKNKYTGKECYVLSYDEVLDHIEYTYNKTWVYSTTLERWKKKFTFVRSP